jgi:hypothetical protein
MCFQCDAIDLPASSGREHEAGLPVNTSSASFWVAEAALPAPDGWLPGAASALAREERRLLLQLTERIHQYDQPKQGV